MVIVIDNGDLALNHTNLTFDLHLPVTLAERGSHVMALRRFSSSIDGTIPVAALLYNDEELLGSQESVGIYDG